MADSNKRKERPGGSGQDKRGLKRSKGGSGGKWQTPHQKVKEASRGNGKIEPGDAGIWATCARNQEGKATGELKIMLEECAERFYGIVSRSEEQEDEEDESMDDIESSIQREVASLGKKQNHAKLIAPVRLDLQCVLFFKIRPPIEPVDFVHRICKEVVSTPSIRRMKYINRLTPMTLMGKATEKGLEEVGRVVLGQHFNLREDQENTMEDEGHEGRKYAIRPTTRNHTAPLKRDGIIKQIANLISDEHKVDLTSPEKVIIVEIYQTVCGVSVVESDWESLKRFNLAELYSSQRTPKAAAALASASDGAKL
ncbi:uncharacterized protein K444DRAFT_516357 [Hyaloscypha bicolor E]|uniref:THUMP domain-containing protein n=1 Tax=Hyaloscypha bicolor E TaxID=1095630 RepID=A0A2J6TW15_9HELO|nr:uncharacterized protein K444DRAFT_516357 [Hyaloscypha bicolor E]PMD67210.1 hypothetical protein K444DRAFT_516357 [Hyaloscypha bicolor E]